MVSSKRMMARVGLVLGAAFVSFGYVKCTFLGTTTTGTGTNSDFSTTLSLRDSAGSDNTTFRMGQAIQFNLQILNQGAQTDTLSFPDAQIYDIYVLDANSSTVRWQWSADKTFTQGTTTLNFAANTSKSYNVLWNGVLADGTQLPAGNYRARGVIVSDDFTNNPLMTSDLGSNIVNFTVQ